MSLICQRYNCYLSLRREKYCENSFVAIAPGTLGI